MKVQVLQEGLSRAVGELARGIPSKSPIPITANVLLKTEGGRLLLTADNLDQRATVEVGAMVVEEGAITVDGRRFGATLANLPAVSLSLDVVGTELAVDGGSARLRFPTMAAEDFPRPSEVEWGGRVEIPAEELRTVARHIAVAAATDDSRPVLTGVVLATADGQRTWAAADGFRLHVHGSPTGEPGIIIPAKGVRLLAGMVAGGAPVRLEMDAGRSRLRATWDGHEFTTLAVQGTFPNYRQLIPDEFSATWEVDAPALLHAVRIAAGFAETGMVQFYGREGRIRVRGFGQGTGEGEATVDAEIRGSTDEIRFALSTRYATEALAAFEGSITVSTNGPTTQAVFRGGPLTAVVMPMFVEWGS